MHRTNQNLGPLSTVLAIFGIVVTGVGLFTLLKPIIVLGSKSGLLEFMSYHYVAFRDSALDPWMPILFRFLGVPWLAAAKDVMALVSGIGFGLPLLGRLPVVRNNQLLQLALLQPRWFQAAFLIGFTASPFLVIGAIVALLSKPFPLNVTVAVALCACAIAFALLSQRLGGESFPETLRSIPRGNIITTGIGLMISAAGVSLALILALAAVDSVGVASGLWSAPEWS